MQRSGATVNNLYIDRIVDTITICVMVFAVGYMAMHVLAAASRGWTL